VGLHRGLQPDVVVLSAVRRGYDFAGQAVQASLRRWAQATAAAAVGIGVDCTAVSPSMTDAM